MTLTTAISAPAQIVNGDASMDQQLAQKWCSDCHAVGAEDAEAYSSVPSFVLIAEMCFSIAQWKLAKIYATGDGVPRDDIKAYDYFSQIVTNCK
jgi:TPR repeat protein